jgi:hypothetical protein
MPETNRACSAGFRSIRHWGKVAAATFRHGAASSAPWPEDPARGSADVQAARGSGVVVRAALLDTDPAAALAALELHKRAFPREELGAERKGVEKLTRAMAASLRQAQ